jgi:hypothetical protein
MIATGFDIDIPLPLWVIVSFAIIWSIFVAVLVVFIFKKRK